MACLAVTRARCTFGAAKPARQSSSRPVRVVVQAVQRPTERPQATSPKAISLLSPAAIALVSNIIMALPASAEAGKLFDFNLTLPVMAGEFLFLMVFLEKFWFTPVGKILDERDAIIRKELAAVKDGSGDLEKITTDAEKIIRDARTEVTAMINSQKLAKQAELDKIYGEAKDRVTREVESSLAALEKENEALLAKLDAQVDKISNEVLKRVLPEGVRV